MGSDSKKKFHLAAACCNTDTMDSIVPRLDHARLQVNKRLGLKQHSHDGRHSYFQISFTCFSRILFCCLLLFAFVLLSCALIKLPMNFIFTSNANIMTAASAATRCSHEIYPGGRVPRPSGANVVVIADVHGDMKHFLAALVAANVVDKTPPHAWRKGNKDVLVLLGDLNDRGPDTNIVLEAVHQWMKESMNNGGRE